MCRVSSLEFSYIPPHLAFHHYASPCAHYTSSVLVTAEQIIQQQQEKNLQTQERDQILMCETKGNGKQADRLHPQTILQLDNGLVWY